MKKKIILGIIIVTTLLAIAIPVLITDPRIEQMGKTYLEEVVSVMGDGTHALPSWLTVATQHGGGQLNRDHFRQGAYTVRDSDMHMGWWEYWIEFPQGERYYVAISGRNDRPHVEVMRTPNR